MNSGRTEKAIKIIATNIIQQIVIVLSGLILPKFFLLEYGSEVNGLVTSIKQFMTYFGVVGAGIGVACNTALFKPLADNNLLQVNKVLSATAIFFRKSGYFFISLISGMVIIYPFIIDTSIAKIDVIILIIVLSFGSIIEYMVLNKYRVLIAADQKLYVESRIQAEGTILNFICSIILIKLHCSVIIVQLVVSLVYLVRTFRVVNYVKTYYPKVSFKEQVDLNVIPNRWSAAIYQIANILIIYTPVLLLTFFCGLREVSVYTIYNMVFSSLAMIIGVFSSGLAPSFGNVIVKGNKSVLINSFRTYIYIIYCIGFICYASAYKLILPFVLIYTKGVIDVNYSQPILATCFVIIGISNVVRIPALTLVEASGMYRENMKFNIMEAILIIIISFFTTIKFGLSGVLMGAAIISPIRTLIYIYFICKKILKVEMITMINTIIINIICVIFIMNINIEISTVSFFNWVISGSLIFVISSILILVVNSFKDRNSFLDIIDRIINIKKKIVN